MRLAFAAAASLCLVSVPGVALASRPAVTACACVSSSTETCGCGVAEIRREAARSSNRTFGRSAVGSSRSRPARPTLLDDRLVKPRRTLDASAGFLG